MLLLLLTSGLVPGSLGAAEPLYLLLQWGKPAPPEEKPHSMPAAIRVCVMKVEKLIIGVAKQPLYFSMKHARSGARGENIYPGTLDVSHGNNRRTQY